VTRPPVNLSARINGTNLDIYIYFWNMTPQAPLWTELYNWTSQSSGWYSVTELDSNNGTTEFIFGDTGYTWSVNATDGLVWQNWTYTYTTNTTVTGGVSARNDTNDDNVVDVFDLSTDWANRAGVQTYDRLYDVNNDNVVDVFDLSTIWAGRS
jgi:hypothetical protein